MAEVLYGGVDVVEVRARRDAQANDGGWRTAGSNIRGFHETFPCSVRQRLDELLPEYADPAGSAEGRL